MIEELVKTYKADIYDAIGDPGNEMLARMDLQRDLWDYVKDIVVDNKIPMEFQFYGYTTRGVLCHYEPFRITKVVKREVTIHELVDMLIDGFFEYTKSLDFWFHDEGYPSKSGNVLFCCGDLKENHNR